MTPDRCRALFSSVRVARMATNTPGPPRLVPIVFDLHEDTIAFAVDHKPKRTTRLARIADIERDPAVTVLADAYDEDWTKLWWVRAEGTAAVIGAGKRHGAAVDRLAAKYEQYRLHRPSGPVILVAVGRWSGWSASGGQ